MLTLFQEVSCKVKVGGNKVDTYTFDYPHARQMAKEIPAGSSKTKSGYPHEFRNMDGIQWTTSDQRQACMSAKTKTLEFPILTGRGKKPPKFKFNESKGSSADSTPGACRLVVTEVGGSFCGIMCHNEHIASAPNESEKGFTECR
jgi:hypothetical protein